MRLGYPGSWRSPALLLEHSLGELSQLSSGAQGAISVPLCLSTSKAFCNCPVL